MGRDSATAGCGIGKRPSRLATPKRAAVASTARLPLRRGAPAPYPTIEADFRSPSGRYVRRRSEAMLRRFTWATVRRRLVIGRSTASYA